MKTRLLLLALLASIATVAPAQEPLPDPRATLRVGGVERSYILRLPASPLAGKPLPLVLVLHGGGGNADYAERMTGFTLLAMQEGFAVAYPEGSSRLRGRLLTWNARHCCGYAMENKIDDVAFIDALISHLIAEHGIDPRRVYVTGMSNGGMMAHQLGIALSHRIAAIAPVVGALFGDEAPAAHPVAALMINGELDRSVPFAGGPPGGRFASAWDGTPTRPASEQGSFWARANQCAPTPQLSREGSLSRSDYRCPAGREVTLLALADNGHAWPGGERGSPHGDAPGNTLDASTTIWQFFRRHARP